MTKDRADRETAAGKAQRYHTFPEINLYAAYHAVHDESTFRVDGHSKSVLNNRRRFYKTATPTRRLQKNFKELATY